MDKVGFASAARWYIDEFSERTEIKVNSNLPDSLIRFPEAVELALFRVPRENIRE